MATAAFDIGVFVLMKGHQYGKVVNHTDDPNKVEVETSNGAVCTVRTSKLEEVSIHRLAQIQKKTEQLMEELEFFEQLEQFVTEQQIQRELEEKDW